MRAIASSAIRGVVFSLSVLTGGLAVAQSVSGDFLRAPAEPLPYSYFNSPSLLAPLTVDASVPPISAASDPSPDRPCQAASIGGYNELAPAGHLLPACNGCPTHGFYGFFGYDSWRGVQDDGWGNNGLHKGLNFATRLGPVSDWTGFGFQMGGSVGVYNFTGTDYRAAHNNEAMPQGFLTYGFFRKANEATPWNVAVVQDWMFTSNFGIFAQNPTLSQWRGQVGYAFGPLNEIGLWGALRGQDDTRDVAGFGPTRWRSVQQLSTYWHYKWAPGGADSWISFGVPEHDRMAGGGSLGDYVVSALATAPLNDRFLLYTQVTYMHPSSSAGPQGSGDEAWLFFIGVAYFHGKNARTETVAGQCWMPQLPVANNGTFLVDTNRTY